MNKSHSDELFLKQCFEIVEAHLHEESFGVNELVNQLNLSHSQVHRKLKSICNQSTSQFIREIRLQRAKEILSENRYTVSQVAYMVGFNSPSYFNKCFHNQFGYPPGDTLHHEMEKKVVVDDEKPYSITTNRKYKILWIVGAVGICIVLFILFFFNPFSSSSTTHNVQKTIAMLPIKNLNNDEESKILADGIMEDILNRLSQIKELNVKSRSTTEKYQNTDFSLQNISKELGVRYILEGSLLQDGDKIRVYIQLTDVVHNKQIWSDQYNQEIEGIITFISDVSQQICDELETIITPNEKAQINKNYTLNTEAYNQYLKGIFFLRRRKIEDLEKSILYFNNALSIDSNYALAFEGLADANLQLAMMSDTLPEKYILESKKNANKALQIDNQLSVPHSILGLIISRFEFKWEAAEQQFLKAIQLNPNNSIARFYYAAFLRWRGRFKEAILQCDTAINIDPNYFILYSNRALSYYNSHQYELAIKDVKRAFEFSYENEHSGWTIILRCYIRQGEGEKAIALLREAKSENSQTLKMTNEMDSIYAQFGLKEAMRYYNNWRLTHDTNPNYMTLSKYYCIIGDYENAIKYFENATILHAIWAKHSIDFEPISNDPRFIAIINKMGLQDL